MRADGRFYCINGVEMGVVQTSWDIFVTLFFSLVVVLTLAILCLGERSPLYNEGPEWYQIGGKKYLKYPIGCFLWPLKVCVKCLANAPGNDDEDVAPW